MLQPSYNLDEVPEYFEFILGGNTYQFRYLTAEQFEELIKVDDNKKADELLNSYISSKEESAPGFSELYKKMTAPQIRKFFDMIRAEFSGNGSN